MRKLTLLSLILIISVSVIASGCLGNKSETTTSTQPNTVKITLSMPHKTSTTTQYQSTSKTAVFRPNSGYALTVYTSIVSISWTGTETVTVTGDKGVSVITIGTPGMVAYTSAYVDGAEKTAKIIIVLNGYTTSVFVSGSSAVIVYSGRTYEGEFPVMWTYSVFVPAGKETTENGWTVVTITLSQGDNTLVQKISVKDNTFIKTETGMGYVAVTSVVSG